MKKVLVSLAVGAAAALAVVGARSLQAEGGASPKGMGLTVEPGGLLVQNVPPGEAYDFKKEVGISLTIRNRDERPRTYLLTASKPSAVGTGTWLGGYSEIPASDWIWFEQNQVTVPPNGASKVNLYLKVPDEERYYNQHWAASLGVTGKPGSGEFVALAAHPRIEIETLSNGEIAGAPDGVLTAVPSVVRLEAVLPGTVYEAPLRIFNNDGEAHRYRLTPAAFPRDPKKRQITPSAGFSWIPDPGWIQTGQSELEAAPHTAAEVKIAVKVPEHKTRGGRKWEAVLLIESEQGASTFARIQIQTERSAGT